MVPGVRSEFGTPKFEPEVFRKQMYCIEESTCDILEPSALIRRPHSDSAPRELFPLGLPWLRPCSYAKRCMWAPARPTPYG